MIHLDTNFLVSVLRSGSAEETKYDNWFKAKESVGISAWVWAEFLCGPLSKRDEIISKQLFLLAEPLSGMDAEIAARLFNETGRRSRSLADCMIAAVAIRCGAKLARMNTSDFERFVPHGLALI